MADLDLQAIHDEMISVAHAAGEMMLAANPGDINTGTKLNCKLLIFTTDIFKVHDVTDAR